MNSERLTVRSAESDEERLALYRVIFEAFADEPTDDLPEDWLNSNQRDPRYRDDENRCVFGPDGSLFGGLTAAERTLRIDGYEFRFCAIGAVCTTKFARRQGAASALLRDTTRYAKEKGYSLLLLEGVPGFYGRFGYTDILDVTELHLDRKAIAALPESSYETRPAAVADYPEMMTLNERYHRQYSAAVLRTDEVWRTYLEGRQPDRAPVVAVSDGKVKGYFWADRGKPRPNSQEVVAEDWLAALALLKAHSALFSPVDSTEPTQALSGDSTTDSQSKTPNELRWLVPPRSFLYNLLGDHLTFRATEIVAPNAYWQARPASLPALFEAITPLLGRRWTSSAIGPVGDATLRLKIVSGSLENHDESSELSVSLSADGARRVDTTNEKTHSVILDHSTLMRLLFGYRSVEYLRKVGEITIDDDTALILDRLFPERIAWISGADWF